MRPEVKSESAGGKILSALIEEAEAHGIKRVPVHAYSGFFSRHGFREVEDRAALPDKILVKMSYSARVL